MAITPAPAVPNRSMTPAAFIAAADAFVAWMAGLPAEIVAEVASAGAGTNVSAYMATVLDDLTAAAARTTLEMGTAATKNTGTSGAVVPLLNGANTWSNANSFNGNINMNLAATVGPQSGALNPSDANLTVESASAQYGAQFKNSVNAANNVILIRSDRTDGTPIRFTFGASTIVGSISQDGANTSYNSSSDYRMKENIEDLDYSWGVIKALKPKWFGWKHLPEAGRQPGFLAHEVQEARREAVTGEKDAVEDIGDLFGPAEVAGKGKKTKTEKRISHGEPRPATLPDGYRWVQTGTRIRPQQLDVSKLIPDLVAALQQALVRIEALEAKAS